MRGRRLTQYFLEHNIGLFQSDIIPKPDYLKTFRFKVRCSFGIAGGLLGVLPAVEFNDQLSVEADEIDDIRRYRMLPPEFESAEVAVFQVQP